MITRLRLIKIKNKKSILDVSEDSKFIGQLRGLIECYPDLPFFTVVGDLSIHFNVDAQCLSDMSIQHFVYGNIRKCKNLFSFLINVVSTLKVVLSSYNSNLCISMPWSEMLAYLNDYRNPYITFELLPRTILPKDYIYVPVDNPTAFQGDDSDTSSIQVSRADTDGGSYPRWNTCFKFNFAAPAMLTCKVLSTEIAKMKIDGSDAYVIVMVREGTVTATTTTSTTTTTTTTTSTTITTIIITTTTTTSSTLLLLLLLLSLPLLILLLLLLLRQKGR